MRQSQSVASVLGGTSPHFFNFTERFFSGSYHATECDESRHFNTGGFPVLKHTARAPRPWGPSAVGRSLVATPGDRAIRTHQATVVD